MRKEFAVSLGVLLLLANSSLPQEPKAPAANGSPRDILPKESNPDKREATVAHLLKAAEHLEAAGRTDDATKLREDAKRLTPRDDLLSRKEAELECLQQEVDRLRALAGQDATVLLEFVTVEVDRRKLGLKAREFDKLIGRGSAANAGGEGAGIQSRSPVAVVQANPARLPLFRELREKGAVRVLSEPTLTSASGRPASFLSGGQIPVQAKTQAGEEVRYVWYGTRIEVLSVLLSEHRIRMNADVELRILPDGDSAIDAGSDAPQFNSRRFRTEVEIQLGQTLTLLVDSTSTDGSGEATKSPATSDSIETITFITPRLAHPRPDAPIVPVAADGDLPPPPQDFSPEDWREFGPPMPVLKRRTSRD